MRRHRSDAAPDISYNPDGSIKRTNNIDTSNSQSSSAVSRDRQASSSAIGNQGLSRPMPSRSERALQDQNSNEAFKAPIISAQFPWRPETDKRLFQAVDANIRKYSAEYYEFQEFYKRFLLHKQKSGGFPSADMGTENSDLLRIFSGSEAVRLPASVEEEMALLTEAQSLFGRFLEKKRAEANSQISAVRKTLPVFRYREQILELIRNNQVTIVAAETGAGKSTQVPQYLLEDGYRGIVCTQPRRIACVTLAQRVQQEHLSWPGSTTDDVGYQIRFEKSFITERKSESSEGVDFKAERGIHIYSQVDNNRFAASGPKLLFLTEGILMRQIRSDPMLSRYNMIIIDEVHERHAMVDFMIGLLRRVLPMRPNLKLVLMSATIQADLFSKYFLDAPLITVPGKTYPVDIEYYPIKVKGQIQEDINLVDDRMIDERRRHQIEMNYAPSISAPSIPFDQNHYLSILKHIDAEYPSEQRGHLLIFMPGFQEIAMLARALEEYAKETQKWLIMKLHSALSMKKQDKVFMPTMPGVRKCIISTNIAETSVTLPDIRFVVDSGRMKELEWDSSSRMQRLNEVWISQASAKQRTGRAGRTGPGKCWRLYTEREFEALNDFSTAELVRGLQLDQIILQMKSMSSVDAMSAIDSEARESSTSNSENFLRPMEAMSLSMTPSNKDISDPRLFNFLQKPSGDYIEQTLQLLRQLGALDNDEHITILGNALSLLPLDVIIGKMLVFGSAFQMVDWVMMMAATLSVQSPFLREESPGGSSKGFTDEYDTSIGFSSSTFSASADWEKEKRRTLMAEGDPFTLIQVLQQWILMQSKGEIRSRTWCAKMSLEEQRLYEMIKLIQQFKSLVRETENENSGDFRRENRKTKEKHAIYEEFQRQKHSQKDTSSAILSTTEPSSDTEDLNQPDLLNLEFRSKHNVADLYEKFARIPYFGLARSEKVLLQLILCSGLYPNIAVPDDGNTKRRANEYVFHTKYKKFVLLHPTSVFSKNVEWIPSYRSSAAFQNRYFHGSGTSHSSGQVQLAEEGLMDIASSEDFNSLKKNNSTLRDENDPEQQEAPKYPSFLCYVQLMETTKPFLINVFHVPALISSFLFGKIDTNSDCTLFIIDDWIIIELKSKKRFSGQSKDSASSIGKQILRHMIRFREEWMLRINDTLWTRFKFSFNHQSESKLLDEQSFKPPSKEEIDYLSEDLREIVDHLPTDIQDAHRNSRKSHEKFLDHLERIMRMDEAIAKAGVFYEIDMTKEDDLNTLFPQQFTEEIPPSMKHPPKWTHEREKVGVRVLPYLTLGSVHYPTSIIFSKSLKEESQLTAQIGTSRSVKRVWECPKCYKTMMLNETETEEHLIGCSGPLMPAFKKQTTDALIQPTILIPEPTSVKQGYSIQPEHPKKMPTRQDSLGKAAANAVKMISKIATCPKCGKSISTPIEKLQHRKSCQQ